ncbi:sodium channel protein Nach-like isoform X2 [Plodia interpunctella]|uniref:sodium channel protein Nach-like isoform X2 n=1 Tax=Plodia interpunctella TaxID=58824 RepID=UPI0023683F70|nr:sodium channel protein Nach-like isoform X2 [Plodia interpunctella]
MAGNDSRWWTEYRRQQLKLQPVGFEVIVRRSLRDVTKEYVTHSSLACVSKIGDSQASAKSRLIPLVIFCFTVGMTCYFTVYTLSNALTKPLFVSMESSTYPIADIDFPAVAVCNVNRISKKALKEYAAKAYPYLAANNESLEEVEWWFYQYGRLLDYTWDERLSTHPFMDVRSKYHIKSSEIFKKMSRFAPKCEDMVLYCIWAGDKQNCSDLFAVRRTFRGHCCVFNYVLDYNSGGRPRNTIAKAKRQVEPGSTAGLILYLDPMVNDYAYPVNHIQGFDIFLFDPAVYLDPYVGRVVHRVLEVNKAMFIELQSVKQIATQEIRKYPLSTRNCLFRDESPAYGVMYSYSTCLIHCRIKTVQSLCKCTPYFLPANVESTEICTMEKLRCLNKYKEKLLYIFPQTGNTEGLEVEMQDSLYCPDCLPDCEFTKHYTRVSKMPLGLDAFRAKEMPRRAFGNVDRDNKSLLFIYQSTSDGVLDRLDIVNYWFEILSNFGGFAGIVIGFSIISVYEILYFYCIRFCYQMYVNYKRYS